MTWLLIKREEIIPKFGIKKTLIIAGVLDLICWGSLIAILYYFFG